MSKVMIIWFLFSNGKNVTLKSASVIAVALSTVAVKNLKTGEDILQLAGKWVLWNTLGSLSLKVLLYCRGGWSTRKKPFFSSLLLLDLNVQTWFFFLLVFFKTPQGYLWKYSSGRRLLLIICHHMYFIFQELWLSPSFWCQESSWISLSHCTHLDCLLLLLSTAILLLLLDGQLVGNTINHSSSWL